ncbi:MAG: biopolymer transporter ExbD [Synergistota bacterium]|jgi:biopolymer transport protein ExbD|nr:biopolymer transporter ExbD [Synergistota bacterium]OPZ34334.1 MAG: Biopolymer transport protein ExbD [Synergistetes bacterium ADurb.BinA166]
MSRRARAELDITPLIDVLFMLIIFFVLTANFLQGKIEVDLPQGETASEIGESPLLLTVRKDGVVLWDGREAASEELASLAADAAVQKREVLLAGDKEAPYGAVARVLEILRREGLDLAGLALQGEDSP